MGVTPEELAAQQKAVTDAQAAATAAKASADEAKAALEAAKQSGDRKSGLEKDLEDAMGDKAPQTLEHIKALRFEAEKRRVEKLEVEAELARVRAEQAGLKHKIKTATLDDETVKETLKKKEDEHLQEQQQTKNELHAVQRLLIDSELQRVAIAEGIPEVMVQNLDKWIGRNGVGLNENGRVFGATEAINKLKQEHAATIEALNKSKPATTATGQSAVGGDPNNVLNWKVPGQDVSFADYQKTVNTGASKEPPPSSGRTAEKPFNAQTATKQEAADYFKRMKQGLKG